MRFELRLVKDRVTESYLYKCVQQTLNAGCKRMFDTVFVQGLNVVNESVSPTHSKNPWAGFTWTVVTCLLMFQCTVVTSHQHVLLYRRISHLHPSGRGHKPSDAKRGKDFNDKWLGHNNNRYTNLLQVSKCLTVGSGWIGSPGPRSLRTDPESAAWAVCVVQKHQLVQFL